MAETKTLNVRFQQKYDTAANWDDSSIVLLAGEMAVESDTGKFKFGNGITFGSIANYHNSFCVYKFNWYRWCATLCYFTWKTEQRKSRTNNDNKFCFAYFFGCSFNRLCVGV